MCFKYNYPAANAATLSLCKARTRRALSFHFLGANTTIIFLPSNFGADSTLP